MAFPDRRRVVLGPRDGISHKHNELKRIEDKGVAVERKYRAIELFGLPGTGKGTQGRILGEVPGLYYFGCGDVLRSLGSETDNGREVQQRIDRGELVPDELVVSIWEEHMERAVAEGRFDPDRELLVLDGLPRTVPQAEMLESRLTVERLLYLTCRDERVLIERILQRRQQQGRADDADETLIRRRFQIYREQTAPVLDHYPASLVREIAGDRSPLVVLHEIVEELLSLDGFT
jgi:adenylate kinase